MFLMHVMLSRLSMLYFRLWRSCRQLPLPSWLPNRTSNCRPRPVSSKGDYSIRGSSIACASFSQARMPAQTLASRSDHSKDQARRQDQSLVLAPGWMSFPRSALLDQSRRCNVLFPVVLESPGKWHCTNEFVLAFQKLRVSGLQTLKDPHNPQPHNVSKILIRTHNMRIFT